MTILTRKKIPNTEKTFIKVKSPLAQFDHTYPPTSLKYFTPDILLNPFSVPLSYPSNHSLEDLIIYNKKENEKEKPLEDIIRNNFKGNLFF